jgi:hypothetical protein
MGEVGAKTGTQTRILESSFVCHHDESIKEMNDRICNLQGCFGLASNCPGCVEVVLEGQAALTRRRANPSGEIPDPIENSREELSRSETGVNPNYDLGLITPWEKKALDAGWTPPETRAKELIYGSRSIRRR